MAMESALLEDDMIHMFYSHGDFRACYVALEEGTGIVNHSPFLLSLKLHGCCWGSAVNKAQRNCEELSNLRTATAQRRSNFHPAAFG